MKTISERLSYLIDNKGVTSYFLASETNISESTFSRILNNKNAKMRKSTAEKLAKYFNVSFDWLFFGEGNLKTEALRNDEITNSSGNIFTETDTGYVIKCEMIPFEAYASYIEAYNDEGALEGFDKVSFNVDKVGHGNYKGFKIKGDSMNGGGINDTPDGAQVLARELGRQHWKDGFRTSQYGWIILSTTNIFHKDIIALNKETGTISCHSRNTSPEYADFELNLNEVYQIFKVIKRTF